MPASELVSPPPVESLRVEPPAVESAPAESVHAKSSPGTAQLEDLPLFDRRRRYYVVNRSWWDTKFGDIEDERGNSIGHLYQSIDTENKIVELREADNQTVAAMIHRSVGGVLDEVEIRDNEDTFLAMIKHKILAIRQNEAWIEDDQGQKMFEAKGNFRDFSLNIYDATGNLAAEVDRAGMWMDIFPPEMTSGPEQKHAIILKNEVDRRLVVSFAIAVDEELHKH
jgi:uncharacterized protein YxjI